jgi:hypothetical protein
MNRSVVLLFALLSSCTPEGVGQFCGAPEDCGAGQECVIVNTRDTVCLPTPSRREPQPCTTREQCTNSSDTVWPIDVACTDGNCRCPTTIGSCAGTDVYEEETCSCVPRGREGAACITSFTCGLGLACDTTKQCVLGEGAGTVCQADNDCPGSDCERRAPTLLGVCASE